MVAYPLESIIPDLNGNRNTFTETMQNISEVYSLPFDPDIVYDIFENCYEIEALLQSKRNGKGILQEDAVVYTMNGNEWRYYPKNINDFLIDCLHVWEIEPIFEPNLVKRNFKLYR